MSTLHPAPVQPYRIERIVPQLWNIYDGTTLIGAATCLDAARQMAALPILIAEAREIIRKVESGEMRSVRTYGAMVRAIAVVEGKV